MAERVRWADRAGELVREAKLPLLRVAESTRDPATTLRQVGQGLRALTIRKRVRDWLKARTFLLIAHGVAWPSHSGMIIDYVQALAEEGSSRSAAWDLMGALRFLERGGGVRADQALHLDPAVAAAVAEARQAPSKQDCRERKVAPQLFVAIVEALERHVVDLQEPEYTRMYAWWRLLKVYGTLRFDDHRGLLPESLELGTEGLVGKLARTKTSGRGKAKETLPLWVASAAAFSGEPWLSVGHELWANRAHPRDYFLMLPSPDLSDVVAAEARYTDACAMSRAVLGRLKTSSGEPLLVDPASAKFWTEHSERATLPSWCATIPKFPGDWIDVLGRWGASCGESYVRTHKRRVSVMQEAAVEVAHQGNSWVQFSEERLFLKFAEHLEGAGMDQADLKRQRTRLQYVARVPPTDQAHGDRESPANEAESGGEGAESVKFTVTTEPFSDDEAPDLLVTDPAPNPEPQLGYYIISIRQGSRIRTLHLLGSCHRTPGQGYSNWEVMGEDRPPPETYTQVCKQCWPHAGMEDELENSESSSDERA
jgi:hypothetical protein